MFAIPNQNFDDFWPIFSFNFTSCSLTIYLTNKCKDPPAMDSKLTYNYHVHATGCVLAVNGLFVMITKLDVSIVP